MAEKSVSGAGAEALPPDEPGGVSALIARVLNQLSLSAWLPGAFLVTGLALLNQFRNSGSLSLEGASQAIAANWLPIAILAVPTLIVATLLTQAFSFEAIRTLEGYWRRRGPASWIRTILLRIQMRRKRAAIRRCDKAWNVCFQGARPELIKRKTDGLVLLAIEADLARISRPENLSEEQEEAADGLDWWTICPPWQIVKVERLTQQIDDFPVDSRVMPTKLGNVLRSTEDRLVQAGDDLEGFALRARHASPARVQMQHDQFRTRLDMYCTLVYVAGFISVVSIPLLWSLDFVEISVTVAVFALLACASYGAAIASARGYCTALRAMHRAMNGSTSPGDAI